MNAITIGIVLVCTNAPMMKTWEEDSKFMIWESQQLPSLESLHLRARHVFVHWCFEMYAPDPQAWSQKHLGDRRCSMLP